jgi:ankyrin repeat protein
MLSLDRVLRLVGCVFALLLVPVIAGGDEIHTEAQSGSFARVQELISADPSLVNHPDERNCMPIHFACHVGSVDTIKLLLANGARLTDLDVDGDTPLHWAAINGHTDAVIYLIEQGAALNTLNNYENTPLMYATQRLRFDTVRALVRSGADPEISNDYGRTPLLYNVREGGNVEMAKLLLDLGANVNTRDRYDDTPLTLAAWRGFGTLTDLLMDRGAAVEVEGRKGDMLLIHAIERGMERLYREIVAKGKSITVDATNYGSPLHRAAEGGAQFIVQDLISRGAEIGFADIYGYTPLHFAAVRGRADVVRLLLRKGADPSKRSLSGDTAMQLAERENHSDVIDVFDKRGLLPGKRKFPKLSGPYFGQTPPEQGYAIFAPDIVSGPWGEHSSVSFSPDGMEAYWVRTEVLPDSGYSYGTIWCSREKNGAWTPPARASFAMERGEDVPLFTSDGQRLYFLSRRPIPPAERGGGEKIWYVEREGEDWSDPIPVPPSVNSMSLHWQFGVSANYSIYFSSRTSEPNSQGIYRSRHVNGNYETPEFLGIDGSSPFIAPDESYMLFSRWQDGDIHIFITCALVNGGWSEPFDLINSLYPETRGMCAKVTIDGDYLFFVWRGPSHNSAWVKADYLDDVRTQVLKTQ